MPPTLIDSPQAGSGLEVGCDVAAHGLVRATRETLPGLRRRPGPGDGDPLPASFLKHTDEQTVVSLAAVLQAMHVAGFGPDRCTRWGVVAAPRFLGRVALAAAMQRFVAEGAWGVSPHIIPHFALHSASGTISQALGIHGPNLGAGGGTGGEPEALLAAMTLLGDGRLPGVWVVLSGWSPEMVPAREGAPASDSECRALALALVGPQAGWRGPRLRIVAEGESGDPEGSMNAFRGHDLPELQAVLTMLDHVAVPSPTLAWPLGGGAWIELGQANVDICLGSRHLGPTVGAGSRRPWGRLEAWVGADL